MRLNSIKVRGLKPYSKEWFVNFRDLPGKLIALIGPNGCLVGDTLVDTPRDLVKHPQGIPIRDLVGTSPLVYSFDGQRLVLARGCNVRQTGTKRAVYRVRLTAGQPRSQFAPPLEITGTQDHRFMLRDGSYRMIQDLSPGDSLMPLYRRCRDGKYIWINRNDGTMELEHRMVGAFLEQRPLLDSEDAHHEDTNTFNNREDNIEVLDHIRHMALHGSLRPPTYDEHPRGMLGKNHRPEICEQIGATMRQRYSGDPDILVRRTATHAATIAKRNQPWYNADLMRELYETKKLTAGEIGIRFNTSNVTIHYWLKKHGIPIRTGSQGWEVWRAKRENHKVVDVQFAGYEDVYDMEVPDYHNFAANGVIVHNSGKSTLLNMYPAGVIASNKKFLFMPGRGSRTTLASLSVARDSFLEIGFGFGDQDYTVRHTIDGQTGKTDCSVTGADGQAILKGKSGVTEFLGWSSDHLLPPEVFFGSVFSSQRTRGMLGMDPAERKQVILKVMGLDRYEKLSKLASEHKRETEKALAVASGKLQELSAGDSAEHCQVRIDKFESEQRVADETLRLGNVTLTDLRSKNEAAQSARAEYDAQSQRRQELIGQVASLQGRIRTIEIQIGVNRTVLAEKDAINDAVIEVSSLESHLDVKQEIDRDLRAAQSRVSERLATLKTERTALEREQSSVVQVIQQADTTLAEKDQILSAVNSVAEFEELLRESEGERDIALRDLEALQGEATVGAEGRITSLRTALEHIRDGESPDLGPTIADSTLSEDDRVAKDAEEHPGKILTLKAEWRQADTRAKEIAAQLASLRRLADRLPEIEGAEARKGQHVSDLARITTELGAVGSAGRKQQDDLARYTKKITDNDESAKALSKEIDALKIVAAKATALAVAESSLEDLLHQKSGLDKELEEAEHKRDGIVLTEAPAVLDLSPYEAAIREAQNTVNNVSAQLAVWREALIRATATQLRRTELQAEITACGQDAADWKRLADDLGLSGLQALLVDAAGPELTTLANDLLRASGDSRFSLKISTTRMDSTGKKELESCDIEITDSRETEPKTGASGGEESFINKALSGAVTMMAVRYAGISRPTLIDDEGDSALSVGYAPGYVHMLRYMADMMDADKVVFTSHRPDSWALADAVITIGEQGSITVS